MTTTTVMMTVIGASGGHQYIHDKKENEKRQGLLHRCFRDTSVDALIQSGILASSADNNCPNGINLLEIGCGAGWTTMDVLELLPTETSSITGIDVNADLIEEAISRVQDKTVRTKSEHLNFHVMSGEEAGAIWPERFDAVWIRFVLVHVPDPEKLMKAAVDCLKPGGILLVEEPHAEGYFADPPLLGHHLLHEAHIEASLKLGGDVSRGKLIGGYMRAAGLREIRCNSFVPLFGRGSEMQAWTTHQQSISPPSEERYLDGIELIRLSLESLAPKLLELEICDQEQLDAGVNSLNDVQNAEYQIFSCPGGQIFQWWARKAGAD